jgi:hypothetical protein
LKFYKKKITLKELNLNKKYHKASLEPLAALKKVRKILSPKNILPFFYFPFR